MSIERDRFQRVILPRVDKAIKAIALIGNGAGRDYQTDEREVAEILRRIDAATRAVAVRYDDAFGTLSLVKAQSAPPQPAPTPPPADGPWAAALEAVGAMNHHCTPLLADAIPAAMVAPLITHLVNRLVEMADA